MPDFAQPQPDKIDSRLRELFRRAIMAKGGHLAYTEILEVLAAHAASARSTRCTSAECCEPRGHFGAHLYKCSGPSCLGHTWRADHLHMYMCA